MNFTNIIIGLTGSMGCGKGEIVKFLQPRDFQYITLSSMVREEARRRGIPEEREKLMEVGNSMRAQGGAGVLAKRAFEKILASGHPRWVVDGIRNPAEIIELKKNPHTFIVGVHANRDILVERILGRARESDAKSREEIVRKIEREWGKNEPQDGQQVEKCMQMADCVIHNEGTLEEFHKAFFSHEFLSSFKR